MSSLSDRQAAHRQQDSRSCWRCGLPMIRLMPGIEAHATPAGDAACSIAQGMARFTAAGWNLTRPAERTQVNG